MTPTPNTPRRVRIANGPTVKISTRARLHVWRNVSGLSWGQVIDEVTEHALATGFAPSRRIVRRRASK